MPSSIFPHPERSEAKSNGRTMPMQRFEPAIARPRRRLILVHARMTMPDSARNAAPTDATLASQGYVWPAEGLAVFPTGSIRARRSTSARSSASSTAGPGTYVALEAEIPKPGDFKRSFVGPTPVVVARGADGAINVFENRCAHRGAEFCRPYRGNAREFVCPYHQWTYDLAGKLIGVPFRRGVKGEGGMPAEFRLDEHGVARASPSRPGAASCSPPSPPTWSRSRIYLGPEILADFDATFDGRAAAASSATTATRCRPIGRCITRT